MKTVNIKGKEYVEVNERIKEFRSNEKYKGYSLESEIVSISNGVCIIKASIRDENQVLISNGIAYETEGSTFINKTSYIENCETSAWGRALGNLGIGIDTSIASSNEVQNAIANQNKPTPTKAPDSKLLKEIELAKEILNKCESLDTLKIAYTGFTEHMQKCTAKHCAELKAKLSK